MLRCFFFFFQAEDGIRDRNVTGVQTCALPISAVREAWQETGELAALAERRSNAEERALREGASDRAGVLASRIAATEARLAVLAAAYTAEVAYGALEDAYHRPLEGDEAQ